jgi:lactoylglutathione lyase
MASTVGTLNHVSVTVARLDRALAFYEGLLGLEVLGRGDVAHPHLDEIVGVGPTRIRWAELAIPGGLMLELFEYIEPEGVPLEQRPCDPGAMHICLEVEALDTLVERLHGDGIATRSPAPVRIPLGDWEGYRSIYVIDPDGITVELLERPPAAQS